MVTLSRGHPMFPPVLLNRVSGEGSAMIGTESLIR